MRFLKPTRGKNQELYIGLVHLHVLHHAAEGPILAWASSRSSVGMVTSSARGTIYPLLHGMERRGWLGAELELVNGHKPKVYAATATGRKALAQARNTFGAVLEMGEGEQKESSPVPRVMKPIRRDNKRRLTRSRQSDPPHALHPRQRLRYTGL